MVCSMQLRVKELALIMMKIYRLSACAAHKKPKHFHHNKSLKAKSPFDIGSSGGAFSLSSTDQGKNLVCVSFFPSHQSMLVYDMCFVCHVRELLIIVSRASDTHASASAAVSSAEVKYFVYFTLA